MTQILNETDGCLADDLTKKQDFFQSYLVKKQHQLQQLQGTYAWVNLYLQSTNNQSGYRKYNSRRPAENSCAAIEEINPLDPASELACAANETNFQKSSQKQLTPELPCPISCGSKHKFGSFAFCPTFKKKTLIDKK